MTTSSIAATAPEGVTSRGPSRREALQMIAADAAADVARFEGQPFTGRTVAEYMGCQAAMIAALARIVATLLPDGRDAWDDVAPLFAPAIVQAEAASTVDDRCETTERPVFHNAVTQ